MARKKYVRFGSLARKNRRTLNVCVGDCIDSYRDRFTAKGILESVYRYGQLRYRYGQLRYRYGQLRYRYGQLRVIWQEGASSSVVYCLLPPTLVYFAVLQPGLFSVYCVIHCTTTRTTFSELPQALCSSAIVFSVTRAVISLLSNILWCHSLLALDILFPGAITMTKLAFLFWMLTLMSC